MFPILDIALLLQLRYEDPAKLVPSYDFYDVLHRLHKGLHKVNQNQSKGTKEVKRLPTEINKCIEEAPYTWQSLPASTTRNLVPPITNTNIKNDPLASSSASSISSSFPPSATKKRCSISTLPSAKRAILDNGYKESSCHNSQDEPATEKYPQQVGDVVVLGPNGTKIHVNSYNAIDWSSARTATRHLLAFVFTNDILATHTLTGNPLLGVCGREKPAKMKLDPVKMTDIIHCVLSKCNCSEREIRFIITAKCSQISKTYRKRLQREMEKK